MVSFNSVFVAAVGIVSIAAPVLSAPLAVAAASTAASAVLSHKRDVPLWERATQTDQFKPCVQALGQKNVKTTKPSPDVVVLHDMPDLCLKDIRTYYATIATPEKIAKEGKAVINKDKSVTLTGVPKKVIDILDGPGEQ